MTSKKNHKLSVEKYLGTRKDGASSSKVGEKINTGGKCLPTKKIICYEKHRYLPRTAATKMYHNY
jgi:hypothetical protein